MTEALESNGPARDLPVTFVSTLGYYVNVDKTKTLLSPPSAGRFTVPATSGKGGRGRLLKSLHSFTGAGGESPPKSAKGLARVSRLFLTKVMSW